MRRRYPHCNKIDGPFAPRLITMLKSPAYRALSLSAHRILARLEIELYQHGAVAIAGDSIVEVGQADDIIARYQAEEVVDALEVGIAPRRSAGRVRRGRLLTRDAREESGACRYQQHCQRNGVGALPWRDHVRPPGFSERHYKSRVVRCQNLTRVIAEQALRKGGVPGGIRDGRAL